MEGHDSRVSRLARSLSVVTSQIFRCHGLAHVPSSADRVGGHDVVYWLVFTALLCGWLLFLYVPQRERISALEERHQTLTTHLKLEKRELLRLQRAIQALSRGDALAWERAARGRLGWVEPGEVTDITSWRQTVRATPPRPAAQTQPPQPPPPAVLPRRAIPPVPVPVPVPPPAPPREPSTSRGVVVASHNTALDSLGPALGTPPLPPIPRPPQPVQPPPQPNRVTPRSPARGTPPTRPSPVRQPAPSSTQRPRPTH